MVLYLKNISVFEAILQKSGESMKDDQVFINKVTIRDETVYLPYEVSVHNDYNAGQLGETLMMMELLVREIAYLGNDIRHLKAQLQHLQDLDDEK